MKLKKFVKMRNERFGAAVFDTLKEKVFVTNTTGGKIVNLLKEGRTMEEIADVLSLRFDASREEIIKDVSDFIEKLEENNLAER